MVSIETIRATDMKKIYNEMFDKYKEREEEMMRHRKLVKQLKNNLNNIESNIKFNITSDESHDHFMIFEMEI